MGNNDAKFDWKTYPLDGMENISVSGEREEFDISKYPLDGMEDISQYGVPMEEEKREKQSENIDQGFGFFCTPETEGNWKWLPYDGIVSQETIEKMLWHRLKK